MHNNALFGVRTKPRTGVCEAKAERNPERIPLIIDTDQQWSASESN